MNSLLDYHNGGAGIFAHVDGPFAGDDPVLAMAQQRLPDPQRPSFEDMARQGTLPLVDSMIDARGFGALGQPPESGTWASLSTSTKWMLGGGAAALIVLLGWLALRREEGYR